MLRSGLLQLEANEKNLSMMINGLADHLKVINRAILDPDYYDIKYFDQIKSIYEMVTARGTLSVPEIHAVIDELRKYRHTK